ncbi:hypothetical protein [Egbenema bharatensis]|uniref:hypothetical protein n=1 Tax=Egbenema bharatensis TaxID=3463334 RepID=UPI003A869C4C
MRLDLDSTEIHWLRHCLLAATGELPADPELKLVCLNILQKIEETGCVDEGDRGGSTDVVPLIGSAQP